MVFYPALSWPFIYSGIFWSWDEYPAAWPYGYVDIFEAAFAAYEPYEPRVRGRSRGRLETFEQLAAFQQQCQTQAQALGSPDETFARIEETVQPTEAQWAALQDLKNATMQAGDLLRTSCPSELPPSPIARLEVMDRQIDVMLQALELLRPPLEKFDRSLTDEQRARFAIMPARPDRYARPAPRRDPAMACAAQASRVTHGAIGLVERAVRPTQAQRDALIDLWASSAKAANAIDVLCSQDTPATPLARLRAVQKRLDATRQAVHGVRTALADFYQILDHEQRARFDAMNAPIVGRGR